MRLHSLHVSGFGPFPDPVEVDFDDVCSAGLFLIHGSTGAGKTSLLDAICFALFADVPGARTRRGLVSDHAPEGTRPVVVLEFSTSGRRLRLERSPDFVRPKRRGAGTTRVPASVMLQERTQGGWRGVSNRHDEVADVLDQVLGMGLAQFAKVVVLPQGDVSAFLRASPEDRRGLLERLFDISTYADVEEWLVQERRRTAATADGLATAVAREVDRLHDHLPDGDDQRWHTLPPGRLPEVLEQHLTHLEGEVSGLLAAADEATVALTATGRALHEGRTMAAHRARGELARTRRDEELARRAEMSALRHHVSRAVAADGVTGHLEGLDLAVRDEEARRAELAAAARGLGMDAETARGDVLSELDARVRAGDDIVSELAHLAAELGRAERGVVATIRAAEAAAAALESATAEVADARATLLGEEGRLAEVCAVAARSELCTREHAVLAERVELSAEIVDLGSARSTTTEALASARGDLLSAQAKLIDLRQRRLDGMAAVLATNLVPDEPCPVCGSGSHPAPASGTDEVDPDHLASAEARLEVLRAQVSGLEQRRAAQLAREEALRDRLGPDAEVDTADLVRRRDAAAVEVDRTRAAREALSDLEHRLETARSAAGASASRATACATAAAAAESTVESATRVRDDLSIRLRDRLAAHADCPCLPMESSDAHVEDVVVAHRSLTAALDRLMECRATLTDAEARRSDRGQVALRAATERGFDDLDEVRSARRSPDSLDRDRAVIADHEQALAVTDAVLSDESVMAALGTEPPDLQALEQDEARARRAVRETQGAHTAAESRLGVLRSIREPLCDLVQALEAARMRAAQVKDLADVVSGVGGGNTLRMRLSSYVLAARLEKVVAMANERLVRMDAGRYLLEHSDARVAGSGRSGLDLRVLDQWTGRSRETTSLSGGESFMVSLALALGLADAVREESGGVDLGTLFVDEGFGSLDDEALEQVMGVLDGLREGGRAVGVVSHVADLRSRITHQVVVTKTATGSGVEVRTSA